MSKEKHTPTPYYWEDDCLYEMQIAGNSYLVLRVSNSGIAECDQKTILSALNNHDRLVEALEATCENLELQLALRGCQTQVASLRADADSYGGLELLDQNRELLTELKEDKLWHT